MKTELKQRMNKVSARSLDGNVVMGMAEWNAIVNLVSNLLSKEAEPVASGPQDVEEFIRLHGYERVWSSYTEYCVSQEDLRAWMAGHARVTLEPNQNMLDAARNWSYKKYDKPIGNDAAIGCWSAMLTASKERTEQSASQQDGV